MGPEALILVTVMGLISLSASAAAVVMARRSWGVLMGTSTGALAEAAAAGPRPIARPMAQQYAGWGRERRVAHWVQGIVRHAHAAIEAGVPATAVFDAGLVDQMRRTDPHIELLLPLVLADLADRENVDPARLSAAFAYGTGVQVEVTPALVDERRQARLERR